MIPAREAGDKHKAWGGARLCERNPRIANHQKLLKPARRATDLVNRHRLSVARFAGWDLF